MIGTVSTIAIIKLPVSRHLSTLGPNCVTGTVRFVPSYLPHYPVLPVNGRLRFSILLTICHDQRLVQQLVHVIEILEQSGGLLLVGGELGGGPALRHQAQLDTAAQDQPLALARLPAPSQAPPRVRQGLPTVLPHQVGNRSGGKNVATVLIQPRQCI